MWANIIEQRLDHQKHMTTKCCCSVDAHYQNGVTSMLLSVWHMTTTKKLTFQGLNYAAFGLPKVKDSTSLTICSRSFLGDIRDFFPSVIAQKGSLYSDYE